MKNKQKIKLISSIVILILLSYISVKVLVGFNKSLMISIFFAICLLLSTVVEELEDKLEIKKGKKKIGKRIIFEVLPDLTIFVTSILFLYYMYQNGISWFNIILIFILIQFIKLIAFDIVKKYKKINKK